ncbi:MAG: hypothetical protein AAFQ92_27735 [Bacteroidota bacterium]
MPDHILKQLAIDIETNGGLSRFTTEKNHNLYYLLNQRKHLYGERGGPLRAVLRRRIHSWKRKHKEGTYISKVLTPWGIVPYRMARRQNDDQEDDDQEDDDSSLTSAGRSTSGSLRRVPQSSTKKKETPKKTKVSTPAPKTPPPKEVKVDANANQPTTPVTPAFLGRFAKMSTEDNKRKERWDDIVEGAGK